MQGCQKSHSQQYCSAFEVFVVVRNAKDPTNENILMFFYVDIIIRSIQPKHIA